MREKCKLRRVIKTGGAAENGLVYDVRIPRACLLCVEAGLNSSDLQTTYDNDHIEDPNIAGDERHQFTVTGLAYLSQRRRRVVVETQAVNPSSSPVTLSQTVCEFRCLKTTKPAY